MDWFLDEVILLNDIPYYISSPLIDDRKYLKNFNFILKIKFLGGISLQVDEMELYVPNKVYELLNGGKI